VIAVVGQLATNRSTALDLSILYWHFVDLVWTRHHALEAHHVSTSGHKEAPLGAYNEYSSRVRAVGFECTDPLRHPLTQTASGTQVKFS
jgi:hypothetical protein